MRPAPRPIARSVVTALIVPLCLAACARDHAPTAAEKAAPPPPRPVLDPQFASVKPPVQDADGRYRTINSGLDAENTVWHVRAALNVAAIGCRGPSDAGTVAAYNAMLAGKKALLAKANKAFLASFGTGGDGQGASDSYMTRLYNYFAMPAAKPGFCAAAAELAPQAAATDPVAFTDFAQAALPKLEAPFLTAYRAVDDYRTASAAWDARYGPEATPGTQFAQAQASTRGPHLAYADLGAVIAWQPHPREAFASR